MVSDELSLNNTLAHPGKRFQAQFVDELVMLILGYFAFYLTDILLARDVAVYVGFFAGIFYFLFFIF